MTQQTTSGFNSAQITHRLIRETIEQHADKLSERIAQFLKFEATAAYQQMNLMDLRQIALGAICQTAGWMEESNGPIIEEGLRDGLAERLKLGFTIADFISTTDIMERELKKFCQEVFADSPNLNQRSQTRLDGIYTIVRTVEARMVMRHHRNKD
jgi:hypothetical protein